MLTEAGNVREMMGGTMACTHTHTHTYTHTHLREFCFANERHPDSSAIGGWIPRPARRKKTQKDAVGFQVPRAKSLIGRFFCDKLIRFSHGLS